MCVAIMFLFGTSLKFGANVLRVVEIHSSHLPDGEARQTGPSIFSKFGIELSSLLADAEQPFSIRPTVLI